MTARPSSAGRCRRWARPCRAASTEAIHKFSGESGFAARRRPHRRRRARAGPGRAFRPRARMAVRHGAGRRQFPSQARPDRDPRLRHRARRFRRPLQRDRAPLSLSHPGAARAAGARPRPRLVGAAAAVCRRHARGRRRARRPARLHHLPRRRLPGQVAGQDARPPRRHGRRRGDRHRRLRRARSCTTRCAPWSARSSWSARANGARTISPPRSPPSDRAACGPVAPARGLYLVQVDYAL